jgi:anthranilate synthase component 1
MNAASPLRFEAFRAAYEAGKGALVWRHDIADLLTPVAAFLKLAHGS